MPLLALTLRTKITALAFILVSASVLLSALILVKNVFTAIENELGLRAMSVARAVAQLEEVRTYVGTPEGFAVIQPIAERVRLATDAAYIVVMDMNRIRYSHPLAERLNTRFQGGDEGPALAEQSYISRARGVQGNSVRAFVPIISPYGREQVGVVVVGMLSPGILDLLHRFRWDLTVSLVAGLALGLVGAYLLAADIKKQMFNLEPPAIARLLEEREAVFSAIGEGLVAIDREGRIVVLNTAARRILGITGDAVGRPVREVIPGSRLPEVVETGRAEFNQQAVHGKAMIVSNRVPVRVKGEIVGAVATFRDRTEVHRMAEALTGVTRFVEALRAQHHESLNKLHTIAGLIQLQKYDEALEFILSATVEKQELVSSLTRRFADYHIAGLLLGKLSRARELGIQLEIHRDSWLESMPRNLDYNDPVVIIGNLVENAMEAVSVVPAAERRVSCLIVEEEDGILIRIADNGPGIPAEIQQRVWESGFTTRGQNRGLGLSLVRQLVAVAGGRVDLESRSGYTAFEIWLPVEGGSS